MDFSEFYNALYDREPFPWQKRLAERVIQNGWHADPNKPDGDSMVIDLPTASGKTSVLDIALFHLIYQQVMDKCE